MEPCDLRLLEPGPEAPLSSRVSSESEVETWDLRASLTEYLCAILRDRRDFQEPLPGRNFFPLWGSSAAAFGPALAGVAFISRLRNTSSREGRVKSVKHTGVSVRLTPEIQAAVHPRRQIRTVVTGGCFSNLKCRPTINSENAPIRLLILQLSKFSKQ